MATHPAKLLPFPSCHQVSKGTRWLCSSQSLMAFLAASTAPVPGLACISHLHGIFSTVAGYIPRVVFGHGSHNMVVLPLPVQRGQHIDVTLVGRGWNRVLHQLNKYLLSICCVPGTPLGSGDNSSAQERQQPGSHGALVLVALLAPLPQSAWRRGRRPRLELTARPGIWLSATDIHCARCWARGVSDGSHQAGSTEP